MKVVDEAGLKARFTITQVVDPFALEGFVVAEFDQLFALLFTEVRQRRSVSA